MHTDSRKSIVMQSLTSADPRKTIKSFGVGNKHADVLVVLRAREVARS